jgi:hypothetical protein
MNCRGFGSLIVSVALIVTVLAGCQTVTPDRSNDEKQIRALMNTFVEEAKRGDLETVMICFAEDFRSNDGLDKKGLRRVLKDAVGTNTEFSAVDMEVTFAEDGKTAEVNSVSVDSQNYIVTVAKRGDKWITVGSQ